MLLSAGVGKGWAPIWESGVLPWMSPGEGDDGGTDSAPQPSGTPGDPGTEAGTGAAGGVAGERTTL